MFGNNFFKRITKKRQWWFRIYPLRKFIMLFAGDKTAFSIVCKFLSVSTWWCNRQCMIMLGNCFHYFFYISKEIPGLLLFRSKQECYLWILIYLPWVLLVQKFWFWLDKSTFPFSYIPCYRAGFLLCSLSNWHKAQH